MIIDLSKSSLFTKDPDVRFAKEYLVPQGTWKKLWRCYKLLEYSNGDLRDYLFIKFARSISYSSMDRWIVRSEIYSVANIVLKKGAVHVNTSIFGNYEQYVIDEITKTLRFSGGKDSRVII